MSQGFNSGKQSAHKNMCSSTRPRGAHGERGAATRHRKRKTSHLTAAYQGVILIAQVPKQARPTAKSVDNAGPPQSKVLYASRAAEAKTSPYRPARRRPFSTACLGCLQHEKNVANYERQFTQRPSLLAHCKSVLCRLQDASCFPPALQEPEEAVLHKHLP